MSGFAARMMAKMGYIEGQGLGKEGEGVITPVEATTIVTKHAGLGYEEVRCPHASASKKSKQSNVDSSIAIRIYMHNSIPQHVAKIFRGHESEGAIKDILSDGHSIAYVIFQSEKDAEAALSLHGLDQDYGPDLSVELVSDEDLPEEPQHRLTTPQEIVDPLESASEDYAPEQSHDCFSNAQDLWEDTRYCTVRIAGFKPKGSTLHSLHQLLKEDIEAAKEQDEDFYQHAIVTGRGEVHIRFPNPERAQYVADACNGCDCKPNGHDINPLRKRYIKPLRVRVVPDSHMDAEIEQQEQDWASGLKTNVRVGDLDAEHDGGFEKYIRNMFRPVRVRELKKKFGQTFAIVSLSKEDAEHWLNENPDGVDIQGEWHPVQLAQDGDRNGIAEGVNNGNELAAKVSGLSIKDSALSSTQPENQKPRSVARAIYRHPHHAAHALPASSPPEKDTSNKYTNKYSNVRPPAQISHENQPANQSTSVKLTNVPANASQPDIRRFFKGFKTKSVYINQNECFGFVNLYTNDEARKAVDRLDQQKVRGQVVGVKLAPPRRRM